MAYSDAISELKAAIVADASLVYQDNPLVFDLSKDSAFDFDGVFQIKNLGGGETYREIYINEPQIAETTILIQVGTTIVRDRSLHEETMETRGQSVIRIVQTPRVAFANVILCEPRTQPRNDTQDGSNKLVWECEFRLLYRV